MPIVYINLSRTIRIQYDLSMESTGFILAKVMKLSRKAAQKKATKEGRESMRRESFTANLNCGD